MKAKKTAAEINRLILQRQQEAFHKKLFEKIRVVVMLLGKCMDKSGSKVLSISGCTFFYDPFLNFATGHTQNSKSARPMMVYCEERGKDYANVEGYIPGKWEQVLEKLYAKALLLTIKEPPKTESNAAEEASEELRRKAAEFGIKC